MIKYVTYDAYDEYGQHIIPVNDTNGINKIASSNYSGEIAKVISSMTL